MELKCNKMNKILELFYEHPDKAYTVRGIALETKIPVSTIQTYLSQLKKRGWITVENRAATTLMFKTKKINYFLEKIVESGLIEDLVKELNPSCIIVFGSFRKGDSNSESDIDIFVESPIQKKMDIKRLVKLLKHNIDLFIEKDLHTLQPHLVNNIVNGIKLYGSFTIK